jgi:hypothetical protein
MKSKKPQWDGRSRPSTEIYKKNFNKIFGVKSPFDELQEELIKGDRRFGAMKKRRKNDKEE